MDQKLASFARSPDFENALIKMQGNLAYSRLTPAEKKSIDFYVESGEEKKESDSDEVAAPAFASIYQAEAEQRVKRSHINGQVKPMTHLSATSNIVERLFSKAKLIMTDQPLHGSIRFGNYFDAQAKRRSLGRRRH